MPDDERAAVERELVTLARSVALGELAGDIAHDVANPLFGVLGLVDLLLEDSAAGSEEEDRLRLLRQTALEMKDTLRLLLDFARAGGRQTAEASLEEAARQAAALVRHGAGRSLALEERYPAEPVVVPCPPDLLVQAVLHLLAALRDAERVTLEVSDGALRLSPAPPESFGVAVAGRIAADSGGRLERDGGWLSLRWTG